MTRYEPIAYTDRERHAIANYERESDRYSRTWEAIAAAAPDHRPALLDLEALSNSKANAFMATAHARLARILPHLDDVIALACWSDQLPNLAAYQPWQSPVADGEGAQLVSPIGEAPPVQDRPGARHPAQWHGEDGTMKHGDTVHVPTVPVAGAAHQSSKERFNLAMLAVQDHLPPELYEQLNTAATDLEIQVEETAAARLVAMAADLLQRPISVLVLDDET